MRSGDAVLVAGESPEVLGLAAGDTLALIVAQRRQAEAAAARELAAVAHWCDLHRADGVGAVDRSVFGDVVGEPLLGREAELRLAGEGTFAVEEFAVAELAAALGLSEASARGYAGQALELRDRLPRLWGRVHAGGVAVWKARRVAEETLPFNPACAEYVDRHLAPFAGRLSLRRILRVVHAAVLRHDGPLARERARAAAETRGVWLGPDRDGVVTLTATTDAPDALAFDTAVGDLAATLAALGDTDPEQVRRARAVGILADPQYALDVHATHDADSAGHRAGHQTGHETGHGTGHAVGLPRRTTNTGPTLHLHLHTDAITGGLPAGEGAVARVPRFGPQLLQTVHRWLTGLAPGARVTVTPVVDLTERIAVDAHEAPDRLRRQIEERDLVCQFPHCGRQGRFDLDHIEAYLPPDHGGPPGQTHTTNLARLCRFHHRIKTRPGTHGRWHYTREPDGTLTWTSPLDRHYRVDHTGTRPCP